MGAFGEPEFVFLRNYWIHPYPVSISLLGYGALLRNQQAVGSNTTDGSNEIKRLRHLAVTAF